MSGKIDKKFLERYSKDYYEREDREEYSNLIENNPFTKTDLETLLKWKSFHFGKTIDKIASPENLEQINKLKKRNDASENEINQFVQKFYKGYPEEAPIFGAYLKHLIKPEDFPIYDKYVHKAFHELEGTTPKNCLSTCYPDYCAFFKVKRSKLKCKPKKLDEALWAYGKYECKSIE